MNQDKQKLLKLPPTEVGGENQQLKLPQNLVLVGANGSGKTRMSIWIEANNKDLRENHRISAQKSLNMPEFSTPTGNEKAETDFLYGSGLSNPTTAKAHGKHAIRWNNKPATHLLNDFGSLMTLLFTENNKMAHEFRQEKMKGNEMYHNVTRLEKIKQIWEIVIPHRTLEIKSDSILAIPNPVPESVVAAYAATEMSDGERAVFYFIGEVLCVPKKTLLIIDEPENHLHHAILTNLWNAIEKERPDCTFIYITHNLDFALSRKNASLIWVQSMITQSAWQYEILGEDHQELVNALGLEMLGSRQKILLVEGRQGISYDAKLYQTVFPEYNVIPVDNCDLVIHFTKAYRKLTHLHNNEVKGLIDRDRRSQQEVDSLKEDGIYVPLVAEIENLFLLEAVIKLLAEDRHKNQTQIDEIVTKTKERVFLFLEKELKNQAVLFLSQERQNQVNTILSKKAKTLEESKEQLAQISQINLDTPYQKINDVLKQIIQEKEYEKALEIINNKGLLPNSGLTQCFGWKKDDYIDAVFSLAQTGTKEGIALRNCFRAHIPLD